MNIIKGNIVDVVSREIFEGEIHFTDKIEKIIKKPVDEKQYILPGFVNSHVHIESSMLSPSAFSNEAVKHGTVAVVSDPHEIANVLGVPGIDFMIEDANKSCIKIFFGAPSCVPATSFESNGKTINSKEVSNLLQREDIYYLSEMMNFPGVIYDDAEVHNKLNFAKQYKKPIDGHAPGITGNNLKKYIQAGITTDHECSTIEEALEKISLGMKIQIREGSAAKNFESLFPIINTHPDFVMLCTDDSHPNDLLNGHINILLQRAWNYGLDYFNSLRSATFIPIEHYHLPVGYLQLGQPADFILCNDKFSNGISSVFVNGVDKITGSKVSLNSNILNHFSVKPIGVNDISFPSPASLVNVIRIQDGELITFREKMKFSDVFTTDLTLKKGFNKIVVINRYSENSKPVVGVIKDFHLTSGAIAGTIAHDSHNLIAVGKDDENIVTAMNLIAEYKGGISACNINIHRKLILPLEIAGLMSSKNAEWISKKYNELNNFAKGVLGTNLNAPFMTMSFLSLLVIPELKLGDKGLFDIRSLEFVNLFEND
jgi:adenine deaminase